jgi:hypothetical protein
MLHSYRDYKLTLIERIEKLSEDEDAQVLLLEQSFYNGISYSFVSSLYLSYISANIVKAFNSGLPF